MSKPIVDCSHSSQSFTIASACVLQSDRSFPRAENGDYYLLFASKGNSILAIDCDRRPLYEGSFVAIRAQYDFSLESVTGSLFMIWLRHCVDSRVHLDLAELTRIEPRAEDIFKRATPCFFVSNAYTAYALFQELLFEDCVDSDQYLSIRQCILSALLIKIVHQYYESQTNAARYVLVAKKYMREHYMENINAKIIADQQWISRSYLQALFKKQTTETINEYLTRLRIEKAAELLISTDEKITDVAFQCGFNNRQWFTHVFTRRMRCPPEEYRRRAPAVSQEERPKSRADS